MIKNANQARERANQIQQSLAEKSDVSKPLTRIGEACESGKFSCHYPWPLDIGQIVALSNLGFNLESAIQGYTISWLVATTTEVLFNG